MFALGDAGLGGEVCLFSGRVQVANNAPVPFKPLDFAPRLLKETKHGTIEYVYCDHYVARIVAFVMPEDGASGIFADGVNVCSVFAANYNAKTKEASDYTPFKEWTRNYAKQLKNVIGSKYADRALNKIAQELISSTVFTPPRKSAPAGKKYHNVIPFHLFEHIHHVLVFFQLCARAPMGCLPVARVETPAAASSTTPTRISRPSCCSPAPRKRRPLSSRPRRRTADISCVLMSGK